MASLINQQGTITRSSVADTKEEENLFFKRHQKFLLWLKQIHQAALLDRYCTTKILVECWDTEENCRGHIGEGIEEDEYGRATDIRFPPRHTKSLSKVVGTSLGQVREIWRRRQTWGSENKCEESIKSNKLFLCKAELKSCYIVIQKIQMIFIWAGTVSFTASRLFWPEAWSS